MKFLFITITPISFENGSAIRSSCLRSSMMQAGQVHTLVMRAGPQEREDRDWDPDCIRELVYMDAGHRYGTWRSILRRRRWIARVLREGGYDVVVCRYVSTALLVPLRYWRRMVIDADDIIKSVADDASSSLRSRFVIWARNALAVRIAARAAHVWFVNPRDRPALKTVNASHLGNVVNVSALIRHRAAAIPGRILMVGLMEHAPNVHGLLWFAQQVLPQLAEAVPGLELHVVGRYYRGLEIRIADPRVILRGFVTELAQEYDRASLVVAPVHFGGGTQLKVIEALAYGRPLVASRFAWEGFAEILKDREHLLVAEGVEEWVARCLLLLQQPKIAEALGRRASRISQYSPATMTAVVRDTLTQVAAGPVVSA